MVEPQSSVHAGRAKILEPDEKIDGGEETLEDLMAKIEAIPSNVRLLKQIGVRESVKRVSCSSQRQMVGMLHPLAPLRARVPMDTQRSLRLARRVFFYAPSPLALTIPRACLFLLCEQCLSAKARHLAKYEMEDPRVLAIITSLMGWEMKQDF